MKDYYIYLIVAVLAIVIISIPSFTKKDAQKETIDYSEYLQETADFDYSNEAIYKKAIEIRAISDSDEKIIKNTLHFVATTIRYNDSINPEYCFEEKASDVLIKENGDCVSMARLVVSLLRANNIPSRTAGGCLTEDVCLVSFSTTNIYKAKTVPIRLGDYKKRGFLHEWVEVYSKDKEGWYILEPTTGQTFSKNCKSYGFYSYDKDEFERCVLLNESFVQECKYE